MDLNATSNSLIGTKDIVKAKNIPCRTEPKRFEIESKNIFYMFAHDMKNPVLTAKGFLSRLLSGRVGSMSENQMNYLELIRDDLNKLEDLITQLLDFLRYEVKTYKPVLVPLDIVTILYKNIETMKKEAYKKDITILFHHPEDVSTVINADAMLIDQVLMNLLDNAIKYTTRGGTVTVRVSIDDIVLVQVIDTGIGISESHLPRIFNPFYRVNSDSAGIGLGLFIVKSAIEAHGGEIWVSSIPGKGSTFSFTLPRD